MQINLQTFVEAEHGVLPNESIIAISRSTSALVHNSSTFTPLGRWAHNRAPSDILTGGDVIFTSARGEPSSGGSAVFAVLIRESSGSAHNSRLRRLTWYRCCLLSPCSRA